MNVCIEIQLNNVDVSTKIKEGGHKKIVLCKAKG